MSSFFSKMFKFGSQNMAIDLGTANTLVYVQDRGIVLNEPSVVAIETLNGVKRVKAVGDDAKLMMGKTPDTIEAIRPLRDGVIADIEIAEEMIKHFIRKVHGKRTLLRYPEIVICVPSGSTSVERRAIRDAASNAGASEVFLILEPMAAAIGADMPVTEPVGSMVVDIGGGTTEVAVLSFARPSLHHLGPYRRRQDGRSHRLLRAPPSQPADRAMPRRSGSRRTMALPSCRRTVWVKPSSSRAVTSSTASPRKSRSTRRTSPKRCPNPSAPSSEGVRIALENTAPELAADIVDQGIVLTGGGALIRSLDEHIRDETGLPVSVAEDPLSCVALGTGRAMEDPMYRGVLMTA